MKPHKIFADISCLESEALNQFYSAIELECVVKGALMPDAHTGYSLPIGAAIATKEIIFPAWVGYDIGCGVCACKINIEPSHIIENRDKIYEEIYKNIPVGFKHNEHCVSWDQDIPKSDKMKEIFLNGALKQLGTLGSGNHFIEIGIGKTNETWAIIHSGSRNLGHKTATHYMKTASNSEKAKEGHYGLNTNSIEGKNYITDLNFALEFALQNRKEIMKKIDKILNGKVNWDTLINRNHNHAEFKNGLWIHRKGATHAEKNMMGVIPGNMRDGSFIVKGKGCEESLNSSSHGAGRIMSRKRAKEEVSLEDFAESMKGIKAKVGESTLDESPFAYKDIFEVMEQQKDLVEVVDYVKPILNIKG